MDGKQNRFLLFLLLSLFFFFLFISSIGTDILLILFLFIARNSILSPFPLLFLSIDVYLPSLSRFLSFKWLWQKIYAFKNQSVHIKSHFISLVSILKACELNFYVSLSWKKRTNFKKYGHWLFFCRLIKFINKKVLTTAIEDYKNIQSLENGTKNISLESS